MAVLPEQLSTPYVRERRNRPPSAAGWTTPRASLDLPFGVGDLAGLRAAVAAHVSELGLESQRLEDVVLVVHELCGNAIRDGGGAGHLTLRREGARLICQVRDNGPGMSEAAMAAGGLPSPRTPGGRGLWLARRFATVRISTGPSGTTVTADLSLR
ncbi:ATP-binding protein [Actinoplanes sp. NPDC089786]|uniref:ATP-binding protein n=1 Tax=Actinoplanes sp. NPDC089786 TaxID=3155185 RepID=UPI003424C50F